jgi:uncharacterized protein (TIGR02118 family)
MSRVVALFKTPPDAEQFDRNFESGLLPLLKNLPGILQVDVTRVTGAPIGEAKYHKVVLLTFSDQHAMNAALASKDGKAVVRSILGFAADLVTVFYGEEGTDGERVGEK